MSYVVDGLARGTHGETITGHRNTVDIFSYPPGHMFKALLGRTASYSGGQSHTVDIPCKQTCLQQLIALPDAWTACLLTTPREVQSACLTALVLSHWAFDCLLS